jgi:hypothetical protein
MCLITKQTEAKIADKDIKCYKVVERCGVGYKTPWRNTYVDYETSKGKKFFEALTPETFEEGLIPGERSITGGFVHCYTDLGLAIACSKLLGNGTCFECIIPKGTPYFNGTTLDICAKKIKFVKPVVYVPNK